MKHTNFDDWKSAVEGQKYTLKQVQGYEQYEALDGDRVVGRWNGEHGYLGEVQPVGPVGFGGAPIVDHTGTPIETDPATGEEVRYGDDRPVVPETNVNKTEDK